MCQLSYTGLLSMFEGQIRNCPLSYAHMIPSLGSEHSLSKPAVQKLR